MFKAKRPQNAPELIFNPLATICTPRRQYLVQSYFSVIHLGGLLQTTIFFPVLWLMAQSNDGEANYKLAIQLELAPKKISIRY